MIRTRGVHPFQRNTRDEIEVISRVVTISGRTVVLVSRAHENRVFYLSNGSRLLSSISSDWS